MTDTMTKESDSAQELAADPETVETLADRDPDEAPEYNLRVSRDKVSVRLDCPDPHRNLAANVVQIMSDFTVLEIPLFPDTEILTNILEEACQPGEHLWDCPIIMGQPPADSVDGWIEWMRNYFEEGWAVDEETGSIDFWEKLERKSVREEELVAKLHNPIDGEPGLNVFGNEIPVNKPKKIKLRSGKGVRIEEQEDCILFYATCNGRLRHAEGSLAVDDVFLVKGNVSLETGNIHHTGAVQIQGDVGTGATIEAEGDIIVKGMLDPCHIICGGTLTVGGGIVGDENHAIKVTGELVAKYISEATVQAGGDISVDNEIAHSNISTRGRIRIEKGRIAGGTVTARMGIKVGEAGASGSAQTTLIAGVDYTLAPQTAACEQKIGKISTAQDKIAQALERAKMKGGTLTPAEAQIITDLKSKAKTLGQAIIDENHTITRLRREAAVGAVEEVVMLEQVWSGTTIQLGEYKTIVKHSIEKPRIAQRRKSRVRVLPLGEGNMPDE